MRQKFSRIQQTGEESLRKKCGRGKKSNRAQSFFQEEAPGAVDKILNSPVKNRAPND
jgi:hypothetical protein